MVAHVVVQQGHVLRKLMFLLVLNIGVGAAILLARAHLKVIIGESSGVVGLVGFTIWDLLVRHELWPEWLDAPGPIFELGTTLK